MGKVIFQGADPAAEAQRGQEHHIARIVHHDHNNDNADNTDYLLWVRHNFKCCLCMNPFHSQQPREVVCYHDPYDLTVEASEAKLRNLPLVTQPFRGRAGARS